MYSCVSVSNYTHTDGPTHTHTHTHTHAFYCNIWGGDNRIFGFPCPRQFEGHNRPLGTLRRWACVCASPQASAVLSA